MTLSLLAVRAALWCMVRAGGSEGVQHRNSVPHSERRPSMLSCVPDDAVTTARFQP